MCKEASLIKEREEEMIQYQHGGDVYTALLKDGKEREAWMDFSANINPLGTPKSVQKAIQKAALQLEDYPDPLCRELREAIAQKEELDPANIVCGNGAADLIFRIITALSPQKAVLLAPTFSEYEKALTEKGCTLFFYALQEEKGYTLKGQELIAFLEEKESVEVLFLCNPNNPTGQMLLKEEIEQILSYCQGKGIFVVVDECFIDFLEEPWKASVKALLPQYECLLILKAFTKLYALAGARLGYALSGNTSLIEKIQHTGQAWSVSSLAQAAGIASLKEEVYVEETKKLIQKERTFLKEELKRLGMKVYGSHANYLFFFTKETSSLEKWLYKRKILIRNCSNYRGLCQGYYRVAVRSPKENRKLIEEIRRWKNG